MVCNMFRKKIMIAM